jgi:16S rRNA (cytidine1402-2'-O)-methyltransferase
VVGILYLVGTPIGNLEDITERAKRILGTVDVVAAEDTRRTGLLLSRLGIRARLVSLFEGNEASRVPELLGRLRSGATVAVVSDAGMPALSDPGHRLVAACVDASIPVEVVPGPSAAVAALVVSGLPTDRFVFEGFIPRSGKARAERLAALAAEPRTIILFESPKRLTRTLGDLLETMGDRRVAVARELTKLHQEVLRGTIARVISDLGERELKGEVAIVLEGSNAVPGAGHTMEEALGIARDLVGAGLKKREAARRAAALTEVPARSIYGALAGRPSSGSAPGPT